MVRRDAACVWYISLGTLQSLGCKGGRHKHGFYIICRAACTLEMKKSKRLNAKWPEEV